VGEGGDVDFPAAANWFLKAANEGHAKAQFNLGVCYLSGDGLKQDEVAVVKWWTLAAMQGHPGASANLDAARDRLKPDQLRIVQEMTADWYSSVKKPH
jgi:TPR repeat protein